VVWPSGSVSLSSWSKPSKPAQRHLAERVLLAHDVAARVVGVDGPVPQPVPDQLLVRRHHAPPRVVTAHHLDRQPRELHLEVEERERKDSELPPPLDDQVDRRLHLLAGCVGGHKLQAVKRLNEMIRRRRRREDD
jgi:hypothetical protein